MNPNMEVMKKEREPNSPSSEERKEIGQKDQEKDWGRRGRGKERKGKRQAKPNQTKTNQDRPRSKRKAKIWQRPRLRKTLW